VEISQRIVLRFLVFSFLKFKIIDFSASNNLLSSFMQRWLLPISYLTKQKRELHQVKSCLKVLAMQDVFVVSKLILKRYVLFLFFSTFFSMKLIHSSLLLSNSIRVMMQMEQ